jgi:hypothetical protein
MWRFVACLPICPTCNLFVCLRVLRRWSYLRCASIGELLRNNYLVMAGVHRHLPIHVHLRSHICIHAPAIFARACPEVQCQDIVVAITISEIAGLNLRVNWCTCTSTLDVVIRAAPNLYYFGTQKRRSAVLVLLRDTETARSSTCTASGHRNCAKQYLYCFGKMQKDEFDARCTKTCKKTNSAPDASKVRKIMNSTPDASKVPKIMNSTPDAPISNSTSTI